MGNLSPDNPNGSPVVAAVGVTESERYLGKLCKRSFLALWSYPGVYRDQGRHEGKGDGKEVCDLLVVFENHIIIFSDKHCHFADSDDVELAWARWYRKAVRTSAEQVWGAERWITQFPQRLFLDKHCTVAFPITLPDPATAIFHRIVVAHDGSRRCHELLGGSGSLMLDSRLVGDAHLNRPFTIGQVDPDKGYVHVFDDTTLNIVMGTLDTISDFTAYLTKKERFLTSRAVSATGEEELLAVYLHKINSAGEHDFVIKENYDRLSFYEGFWEAFTHSPERRAQIESDRTSYSWDRLIEKFAFHAMTGTEYFTSGGPLNEQEKIFRFLAREPRTRRRLLAISLHEVLERSTRSNSPWDARLLSPSRSGDPYYLFLFVKQRPDLSEEEYRRVRVELLRSYCHIVKLKHPQATDIIGIASEAGDVERRSEDLYYLNGASWNQAAATEAEEIQHRLGLLKEVEPIMGREHEYPVDHTGRTRNTKISRNSPCLCGSGKRFKRCCGKVFLGKYGRK